MNDFGQLQTVPRSPRSILSLVHWGWRREIQLGVLLLGLASLPACAISHAESPKSESKGKRPVPVLVAAAQRKIVPILFRTTGTVEAYSTVAVKTQISGQITEVYFQQGQVVHKGDLLFKLDSRPLEASLRQAEAARVKSLAQVNQAKANVAKIQAQAHYTTAQAQRYTQLYQQGAISQAQLDQFQTNATGDQAGIAAAQADVQNAQASVVADEAAINNAAVQLSYASIYSPIDGRTSSLKFTQGNLVKVTSDDPLVVISQIRPIYVTFSIPQRLISDLKQYNADRRLKVEVLPSKGSDGTAAASKSEDSGKAVGLAKPEALQKPIQSGELTFVDSSLNAQTGTLQLKATFANLPERLVPGQFVNVALKLTEELGAIVVPTPAIQTGQKGSFVFVVASDKTVEMRPVVVGSGDGKETVVKKGLQAGEQVVTDGQFNLTAGATVDIKSEENQSEGNSPKRDQS
jgi:multidrug efflux system membrane fusion protein